MRRILITGAVVKRCPLLHCRVLALLALLLAASPVPAESRQMVLSTTPGWDATTASVQRYERSAADQPWRAVGAPTEALVGRSGLGWGRGLHVGDLQGPAKREGDGRAPAGVFALRAATGYDATAPAGTRLPYREATADLRCVDDVASAHYNRLATDTPQRDWKSAEDMRRTDGQYRYTIWVGHDDDPPQPGAGSCIFLHVRAEPPQPTSGCTAMAEDALRALLTWLDPAAHPVLVQLPAEERARRAADWGLPAVP